MIAGLLLFPVAFGLRPAATPRLAAPAPLRSGCVIATATFDQLEIQQKVALVRTVRNASWAEKLELEDMRNTTWQAVKADPVGEGVQ